MQTTQTFQVQGMHCASCAGIVEQTLKKTKGVSSATVNYGNESAKLSFESTQTNPEQLSQLIKPLGYSLLIPKAEDHSEHLGLDQSKQTKLADLQSLKVKIFSLIPLTIFSLFVMGWEMGTQWNLVPIMPEIWQEFFHHLMPLFATYALFVVGQPYLLGVYRFLRYGKANMDTLVGIGTLTAFLYSAIVSALEEPLSPFLNVEQSYYDVTIVVITFISLGKYLEARSKLKTGDAIEKLLAIQSKTALVLRKGHEVEIPISAVLHGDILIIKPAAKIPVDGIIIEGSSYIDEALVTGEPLPVGKHKGDTVLSGTLNTTGTFTFRATKVGSETLLANIIKMVADAQGSKAPIQALADKISAVFVPIVLVLAFITLGTWLLVGTQFLGFSQALSYGLVSFVGILVIACPCALGLATPTAIIVGIGKGARAGILVKDAATLQKLHKASIVVVDKTGTITKGRPELIAVYPEGKLTKKNFLTLLATLETRSEHPIATSITAYAKQKKLKLPKLQNFESLKGKGVSGKIKGTTYYAGNARLMTELGLKFDQKLLNKATREGQTPIILASKTEVLGLAIVADALKPEASEAIKKLHKLGLKVVMLTGDDQNTASFIAKQVGIDEVVAEALPQTKLEKIKALQASGAIVVMAGDGVNDAPALAQADVGIAMSTGTDVAIESAGIILLHGDLTKLTQAIKLSKLTMRGIKQNLFWAFIYNIIGIPLASGAFYPLFGWLLSPIFAGLAMALSSVSVVSNSLRLKVKKL